MAITTVSSHVVSVNAIQGTLIADNAITAVHIATNAVSGTLIADNAVTATHIAQNTITVTQIADDAIEAAKIADGVITTNHLNKAMISSQTEVTPVAGDFVLLGDTSDSNNLKKAPLTLLLNSNVDISTKLNLSGGTMTGALIVQSSSSGATADGGANDLVVENSSNAGISILSGASASGSIYFGDSGSAYDGYINYAQNNQRMGFATAGTGRMYIDSSGKVGIGTSSPASKLHIKNTASEDTAIILENTNNAQNLNIDYYNNSGAVQSRINYAEGPAAWNFIPNTSNSNSALYIAYDAKVGIGTSSPSYKFQVSGTGGTRMMVENTDTNWAAVDIRAGGNQSNYIFFKDDSAERARIQVLDTNDIAFSTGDSPTERLRIASNGRIGIGTTGGNAGMHVANGDIRCTSAAFANDANSISMSQESSGGFITARGPSTSERGVLGLSVNRSNGGGGIVALKINSGGSINYGGHTGEATGSTGGITMSVDNNDRMNFICATTGTGNLELIEFRNPNGTVGDIKTNGSSTSYNTSSDYRLKENVNYTWDATTRLKQLKPARFNFKTDTDKTLDGFLAHEVSSIVPEAISGEKDGMTEAILYVEGDEIPSGKNIGDVKTPSVAKYQGIDQSKLIPLLVKTIQELEARITTLEG